MQPVRALHLAYPRDLRDLVRRVSTTGQADVRQAALLHRLLYTRRSPLLDPDAPEQDLRILLQRVRLGLEAAPARSSPGGDAAGTGD